MVNILWFSLLAIIGLSFVVFLIMIWLGYANNKHLDKGEMRKAITAYFILLFGSLMAFSFFPTGIDFPAEFKGLFAGTITTLIGFYFGARTASSMPKDGE
ncbi:hypothetical protein ACFLTR_03040 [Chloroflexota bacterium]